MRWSRMPYHLGTRSGNEGCMKKAVRLKAAQLLEPNRYFPSGALGLEQIESLVEHFVALGGRCAFFFIILGRCHYHVGDHGCVLNLGAGGALEFGDSEHKVEIGRASCRERV